MSQLGGVRSHDIDGEDHTTEADRVEHLGSAECLHVGCGRHEDQSDRCESCHDEEALRTTPQVKYLCLRKVRRRGHDIGDDVNDWDERVRLVATEHIRGQVGRDG